MAKNDGQLIAGARDKFFETNPDLLDGQAKGQYLKNRIEKAFIAGWHAARKDEPAAVDCPSFAGRAKRYVLQSPQSRDLNSDIQNRLIRGIAKLMSEAYKQGIKDLENNVLEKQKEL